MFKEIIPRESFRLRIQEEEAGLAHFLPPLGRVLPYSQILQEELGLPTSGDTERFKFQTPNCISTDKLTKDNKEACPCPLVTFSYELKLERPRLNTMHNTEVKFFLTRASRQIYANEDR